MYRGTTPTLKFEMPFYPNVIETISIAFAQNGWLVFEKNAFDRCHDYTIEVDLTENETLMLTDGVPLEIQIRCKVNDKKLASNIIKTDVKRILKDGVLIYDDN